MKQQRICAARRADGRECRGVALDGKKFCYFHHASYAKRKMQQPLPPITVLPNIPKLTDAESIRQTRINVENAIAANQIEEKRGRMIIYALQLAAANMRNMKGQRELTGKTKYIDSSR